MSTPQQTPRALRMFDMVLFSVCAILLLSQVTLTAQIGPSAIVWTVLMIALFFLPYGLMTAELGSTYPDTGGIYSWIVRAFGNRWGTRVSWWYWLNVALWVPSVYLMFSVVLSDMFFPDLGFWPQVGIALVLIAINWGVNVLTLETGKWVSNVGAIITVGVILLIGVAGLITWNGDGSATAFEWTTSSMIPTAATMALALPIIIYNFLGFELMSSASNEMRNPRRDVPRTIIIAGVLIGAFYLISTIGMQVVTPAEEISETSGLLDVLTVVFGAGVFTTVVGIGILYAFFAALIPWTIGANRAAAEAAEQGDLPPVFKKMSATRRTPVGAAGFTALVSATITLVYGVLFSLTNGDIDALFWSLFAFSSIVFLLPYVAMSLAFLRLRSQDPQAHRPYRVPGGVVGAWTSVLLVVVLLVAAVFFFVWNPWAEFDATTTWLILGGLAATFIAQEILVRRSSHWKDRAEHPELSARVDLEGIAPDTPEGAERALQPHGGEQS
ncbi:MAG: APC family permease [Actinobacteria bacterium]|nr:APC family permease [Actinomycetota bacterium]MCB8996429.1 APC family permease [Actinomycetota bacterium]MCB9425323.1 APC family permease [Actinomycetota bacterium]